MVSKESLQPTGVTLLYLKLRFFKSSKNIGTRKSEFAAKNFQEGPLLFSHNSPMPQVCYHLFLLLISLQLIASEKSIYSISKAYNLRGLNPYPTLSTEDTPGTHILVYYTFWKEYKQTQYKEHKKRRGFLLRNKRYGEWDSWYVSKDMGVPVIKVKRRGFLLRKQTYGEWDSWYVSKDMGVPVIKVKRRGFLLRKQRYGGSWYVSKYIEVPVM